MAQLILSSATPQLKVELFFPLHSGEEEHVLLRLCVVSQLFTLCTWHAEYL